LISRQFATLMPPTGRRTIAGVQSHPRFRFENPSLASTIFFFPCAPHPEVPRGGLEGRDDKPRCLSTFFFVLPAFGLFEHVFVCATGLWPI